LHSIKVHKKIFRASLLATLILSSSALNKAMGQITSLTADHVDSLAYTHKEGKDPFFIFYQTKQVYKAGELSASLPDGGSYSFEWSKYNPDLPGFGSPFLSELNQQSSTAPNLESGGYQVRIFNSTGTDTSMMAWLMLDGLHAWVHKTEDGNLDPGYRDCSRLALAGFVEEDTLLYYDPVSNQLLTRPLNYSFIWTSDNSELDIPNDTTILAPNITYAPPYEDTWYTLTVTDELGMVVEDKVFYESIQTKAIFTVEFYDKITGEFDPALDGGFDNDRETGSTDAKLTVRFKNASKNGSRFEWVFLDTLGGIKETATTYDTTEMPEFTYVNAAKYYYPYMTSISEEGCEDSVTVEEDIYVEPSKLDIPNVFSPNGDNMNDIWVFKHQSLKRCKITVVDRTGKVVYKIKINDIYSWDGWNGNMHESNRRAPEGQYVYVIDATGYDGQEFRDVTIWENMKIFGGPGNNNTGSTGGTGTGGSEVETPSATSYTGWLYLYRH
jgi:gliding motility-associated-like protein